MLIGYCNGAMGKCENLLLVFHFSIHLVVEVVAFPRLR
jgi:hypothetical protein